MKFLRKGWKKLHRFVYLAGLLAILHMVLLEHGDWAPYAILLMIGFVVRLPIIKKYMNRIKLRKNPVPALS